MGDTATLHSATEEAGDLLACPACLHGNDPAADFCAKCQAPLSNFAAVGPFECAFAQTWVYRRAAARADRFAVVLVMWLVFGQTFVFTAYFVFMHGVSSWEYWAYGAVAAVHWLISAVLLWKTTASYIRSRQRAKAGAA